MRSSPNKITDDGILYSTINGIETACLSINSQNNLKQKASLEILMHDGLVSNYDQMMEIRSFWRSSYILLFSYCNMPMNDPVIQIELLN